MKNENLRIPIAIVVAGVLIAGAVYLSNATPKTAKTDDQKNQPKTEQSFTKIRPVSAADHIVGNLNANVIFVEYSDTECPFCKRFHGVMNQVASEYAKDGKVAWVYRHMPIDQLHPKSRNESAATECVASLGGENAFWKMLNGIYSITPGNNQLDPAELPKLATAAGVKLADFNSCLASGKFNDKVEADFQDGLVATDNMPGTPNSIIILKKPLSESDAANLNSTFVKMGGIGISSDRTMLNMSGAMPYEIVKMLIELALRQ